MFEYGDIIGFEPLSNSFECKIRERGADFFIMHGHNLDPYNNDIACGSGYLITSLLILFETKKRGDLLKKYESARTGNVHKDYIQRIIHLLYDQTHSTITQKNIIVVQGHTHHSYLEDITEKFSPHINPDDFRYL